MKAMLYADWMNLRRSMKAILIAAVVIALASIVSGNELSFVPFILVMLSLMVPATLMSSDYAYGWDKLSLSLPVSRRDVVSSKFAISLLVNLTVAALGTGMHCEYGYFLRQCNGREYARSAGVRSGWSGTDRY